MGPHATVTLLVTLLVTLSPAAAAGRSSRAQQAYASLLREIPHWGEDHWGVNLTTPELIEAMGYPVEIHHVTTED
ncbi:hypothetical protein CGJ15_27560, partial [Vibrio parahaemolyticus]